MAPSHAAIIVSRLYIFFVCFFLAIAPQGEIFWGIISELHTKFFDCFFTGQGEIPHAPRSGAGGRFGNFFDPPPPVWGDFLHFRGGIAPQFGKKKYCQRLAWLVKFFLPKLASLAKSLSATSLLCSPKIVYARLAVALSSHTCVCGVSVDSTIVAHTMETSQKLISKYKNKQ